MKSIKQRLHNGWEFSYSEHNEIKGSTAAATLSFLSATVPGTNLRDLSDHGKIKPNTDPQYESSFAPFKALDFVYRCCFDASEVCQQKYRYLTFEGLDTIAEIYLNDQLLGKSENCHRRYSFDVSEQLRESNNRLLIIFRSPQRVADARYKSYPVTFPTHLDLGFMHVRKPAYSYFWDWGPAIPVSGIFRPVYLSGFNHAGIVDYKIDYECVGDGVRGAVRVNTESVSNADLQLRIGSAEFSCTINGNRHEIPFEIDRVRRWQPNGAGDPVLYNFQLTLSLDGTVDERKQKIGFRTFEIEQPERSDGKGTRFVMKVNGESIFCRGYNWIPFDNDITINKSDRYERLIKLAANANVNMLRIWGGGYYEDDEFYQRCDELGIMVWQDAAFCCTLYPDDNSDFLSEIEMELRDNILRLRNYTSLVMWCGNNECHEGYYEWWKNRHDEFPIFYGGTVYHELFPTVLRELDSDRFYWPGSPYTETKGVAPNHLYTGDSHPWDLFKNTMDYTTYRDTVPSFVSESGIQSFPELRTTQSIGSSSDHHFQSHVFDRRNHFESPAKNERLLKFSAALFRLSNSFENAVLLSQLAQAEYLRYAVEHWRSHAYDCAGALLWQFNDCWPALSWSAIDYNLLPKALHYYMKRAFARDLVGFKQQININFDPEVEQFGQPFFASDLALEVGKLTWEVISLEGTIRHSAEHPLNNLAAGAHLLSEICIPDFAAHRTNCVLRLRAYRDETLAAENLYTLIRPKHMQLRKPEIKVETADSHSLKLSTDFFVKGLYLFHPALDVVFDDNYFDLLPGETVTVSANREISRDDVRVMCYYHE